MRRIIDPSRSQRQVVAQDQATVDRDFSRSIMRRTSVAGLIGLVYGICTGVILAAYHEFGSPSLLAPPRLVTADPTPAQLFPREGILDDRAVTRASTGQESPVTAVPDAAPLTSPPGSAPLSPPSDEIRPAMAPWRR